jgi:hypothetical protein
MKEGEEKTYVNEPTKVSYFELIMCRLTPY